MKNQSSVRTLRESERAEDFKDAILVCTSKMSLPLYMAFWFSDLFYAPDLKWEFLGLRSILIPCNLWFNKRFRKPVDNLSQAQRLAIVFAFFNSIPITIMILMTDGASSAYYAGLNLVSMGILSFFPWTGPYMVAAVFSIFLPFYLGSIVFNFSNDKVIPLIISSFFIVSTIICSIVIRWFNERLRIKEINVRIELKGVVLCLVETLS